MTDVEKKISWNSDIVMHFTLYAKDGSIADSTYQYDQPLSFKLKHGVFSSVMENQLIGLGIGGTKKIILPPEDAFGPHHPSNIYNMPIERFTHILSMDQLEPGLIINFDQLNGKQLPGIIRAVEDNEVEVDFNHPLAGETVVFEIKIIDIKS